MESEGLNKVNIEGKFNKISNNIKRALWGLFISRSNLCKHTSKSSLLNSLHLAWGKDLSCFFNWTFGFVQAAAKMFAIKSAITIILALIKRRNFFDSLKIEYIK